MNKTIRYAVVGLIALFAGGAFADGVPLITAGPTLPSAALTAPQTKTKDFVKLHPITLSKTAFGANVLTVVIDNKEHRFVGSVLPPDERPATAAPQPKLTSWVGREAAQDIRDQGFIVLTKEENGNVIGFIEFSGRKFEISRIRGAAVLIERDPNVIIRPLPMPSPASAAASSSKGG